MPNAPIINAMMGVTKRALDGLMDDPVCIASGRSPVEREKKLMEMEMEFRIGFRLSYLFQFAVAFKWMKTTSKKALKFELLVGTARLIV